ncbi:MAG: IS21 family transposase [Actinobacteria bacterium]|nr:IS21 family transposase [Actinomycetota bacterium]
MEVLEAYDLTGSFRSAALLVGVDHHTVRRYVAERAAGLEVTSLSEREKVSDPFADKIAEWIDRSSGRVRADVVHRKLGEMGYLGSERTTRRVVAALKVGWRDEHRRVYKPWIPEPGLWLQWDYGQGPRVNGSATHLFCGWLAWSRFRVIIPLRDKTLPSVISALDRCFRLIGGVPTYALTDNEKTVTVGQVASLPVRNPQLVAAAHYYGVTITTCVPADPESKGGVEATVRIAKADLVPTEANLRDEYGSWEELEEACRATAARFNSRIHTLTGERPAERLEREVGLLHRVPPEPYTAALGETRRVSWMSLLSFRGARYSVPSRFMGKRVWVRLSGEELVICAEIEAAATEIARHRQVGKGQTSVCDEHYPPRRETVERTPKARNRHEAAFLEIGKGAQRWLIEAAAAGVGRIPTRMAEAVSLTKLFDPVQVDQALGLAAQAGRFGPDDLEAIVAARSDRPLYPPPSEATLQLGTGMWARISQGAEQ